MTNNSIQCAYILQPNFAYIRIYQVYMVVYMCTSLGGKLALCQLPMCIVFPIQISAGREYVA